MSREQFITHMQIICFFPYQILAGIHYVREGLKIPIPKRSHPTNTLLNYLCNRQSNETQNQGKKSEAQENKIA